MFIRNRINVEGGAVRIANEVQLAQRWRIHDLVTDFTLEDVWSLPKVGGGPDDFAAAIEMATKFNPAKAESLPTRLLWNLRDRLGAMFSMGRISAPAEGTDRLRIPGTPEYSITERLPADLRGTADDVHFEHLPFVPVYRTADEFAAEISNRTVHGVMHLAWVDRGDGHYGQQMAVYVKPRGRFGEAYMALIKPFRYAIVYPALERQIARVWSGRAGIRRSRSPGTGPT
jgi:Protein of unknown function (DUF2867)